MLTAEIRATFSAHCSVFTFSDITGVMQQHQSTVTGLICTVEATSIFSYQTSERILNCWLWVGVAVFCKLKLLCVLSFLHFVFVYHVVSRGTKQFYSILYIPY